MDSPTHSTADDRPTETVDVAVIGGGLAGLTAATYAGRAGRSVRVLDARSAPGGRARTAVDQGFRFNEGPHALYRAGEGWRVLRELGIRPQGGNPPFNRTRLGLGGRLLRVPPRRATTQFVGLVRRLGADAIDPGLVDVTAQEWIESRVQDPAGRHLAAALLRVSSYSADMSAGSADGAARQLRAALKGVTYLHGGWAQLVDALSATAAGVGAEVITGSKATSVEPDGDRWVVSCADGRRIAAGAVVLAAGGPGAADRLVGGASPSLTEAAAAAAPVHAACLDLGLSALPKPSVRFVLGLDRPTYASIHTPGAHLADHGHVVHVMHYEPGDDIDVESLELVADELQPGWRDHVVARQVGLRRVVAFDRPRPGVGWVGRPRIGVADLPGVLVAGDWVGPDDLLGSAAIASGRAAGIAAAAAAERVRPVLASGATA